MPLSASCTSFSRSPSHTASVRVSGEQACRMRNVAAAHRSSEASHTHNFWICEACAVQFGDRSTSEPPAACPICEDERQYVKASGQLWTTRDELSQTHKNVTREEEPGVLGIGVEPSFGIGQRSLLVKTGAASSVRVTPKLSP